MFDLDAVLPVDQPEFHVYSLVGDSVSRCVEREERRLTELYQRLREGGGERRTCSRCGGTGTYARGWCNLCKGERTRPVRLATVRESAHVQIAYLRGLWSLYCRAARLCLAAAASGVDSADAMRFFDQLVERAANVEARGLAVKENC